MTSHQRRLRSRSPVNSSQVDNRRTGLLEWVLPDQWNISYIALLVYAFVIVTNRFPLGTSAVIIGIISLLFSDRRLRSAPPLNWMVIFLIWSCVGYFTSDYQPVVAEELYAFLKLVLIALLTVNAIRTQKQARFFLIWVVVWYLYVPIRVTLLNYFLWGYTKFGRAVGPGIYENSNDLAALTLLQMSVIFAISLGLKQKWARQVAVGAGLIMAVVVVLTQSRGGFLGGLAFLALIVGSGQKKLRTLLSVVAALGIVIMLVPSSTIDRFEKFTSALGGDKSIVTADNEGSAADRSDIYRIALMISADHPITGVGLGSYPLANAAYDEKIRDIMLPGGGLMDAHSTYLSTLAETGVPGLVIILLMFGKTLQSVSLARRSLLAADPNTAIQLRILSAGYIGFLVAAVVGTYTQLAITYVHLCAIWAFAETVKQSVDGNGSLSEVAIVKSEMKRISGKTEHQ